MRERRSNYQLIVDLITQLNNHKNLGPTELAGLLRTNTIVISRWLKILDFLQHTPKVSTENGIIGLPSQKITIEMVSTRRKVKTANEFNIIEEEYSGLKEFFESIFEIGEDGDIILIDPGLTLEYVPKTLHLTTRYDGGLPITHWKLFKLFSVYQSTSQSLGILSVVKEISKDRLFIFDTSEDYPHDLLNPMISRSSFAITDPRFWTNLSTNECKTLLRQPTTAILISRINFLSNRLEVFDGIEYTKLPDEAQFWTSLVMMSHLGIDRILHWRMKQILNRLDMRFCTIYNLFAKYRIGYNTENIAASRKSTDTQSIWKTVLFSFVDCVSGQNDIIETLGIYIAYYQKLDANLFPFMSYWLVLQITHLIQTICFPHQQISWLNTLKTSTFKTFGIGTQHLRISGNLIQNAYKSKNFKYVVILAEFLQDKYDLKEYYLYEDDIQLLVLFSSLNLDKFSSREDSPYRFQLLLKTLFHSDEDKTVKRADNVISTPWILNPLIRKSTEHLLEIITKILGVGNANLAMKILREASIETYLKTLLGLLYIKLPEFGSNKKLKIDLSQFLTLFPKNTVKSDLLLVRLLLHNWEDDKYYPSSLQNRIISRLKFITHNDPLLKIDWNVEFSYCVSVLVKKFSKEQGWNKSEILRLLDTLEYRKNLSREPATSPNARLSIYQRMIPRKGRKPLSHMQYFTDLSIAYTPSQLYQILLVREILSESI